MAPGLWELTLLTGLGLALTRVDRSFVAVFSVASTMAIIGGCDVFRETIESAPSRSALHLVRQCKELFASNAAAGLL
jgi:hypothetical protein